MTTLTDTQVITASGGLVELGATSWATSPVIDGTGIDAAASSFATPITISFVSDGSPIMVEFGAREQMTGSTASGSQSFVVVFLDGVFQQRITRVEQTNSLQVSQTCYGAIRLAPSAGSHTVEFKQFRVNANGQIGPGFARVSKIVQATQWPAVTTGTIICTSSTRPASPFEGQAIYETDTDLSLTWSGSAWVAPSVTYKPPMCRVKRNTAQSIPNNSGTSVSFSTSVFDTASAGMWSAGTPTRITIPVAGIYNLAAGCIWDINSSGMRATVISVNGGTYVVESDVSSAGGSTFTSQNVSSPVSLSAGDYVELVVFQNSGVSLNARGDYTEGGLFLAATWLGRS